MRFIITMIGCFFIGVITSLMGINVYSIETGFSIKNTLIVCGLSMLWATICFIVSLLIKRG